MRTPCPQCETASMLTSSDTESENETFPRDQRNAKVRRARDVTALSRLALLLFSGLILAGGFVFAAKQHFAVQFGYHSEDLRTERKRLLEETSDSRWKRNVHCT